MMKAFTSRKAPQFTRPIAQSLGAFWMAMMAGVNLAAAKDPMLVREIIVHDEYFPTLSIQPQAIMPTANGGHVIAGRIIANQSAWAAGTGPDGEVLWRYEIGLSDDLPIGEGAEFTAVSIMPDESIYLCGNRPRPAQQSAPAFLTHLAPNGKLLEERPLGPTVPADVSLFIVYIEKCFRKDDDVITVGIVTLLTPDKENPPHKNATSYYWIATLDKHGSLIREKLIPTALADGVIEDIGAAQIALNGDLMLVAHRNPMSEVLQINTNGDILASTLFPYRYSLVKSPTPSVTFQLWGGKAFVAPELLTLDLNLNVVKREQGDHISSFIANDVYRLSDDSLIMFGSGLHDDGPQYSSRVSWIRADLKSESYLDLAKEPFYDSGYIAAVVPTSVPGEFAAVRDQHELRADKLVSAGAAIDFIRVK